MRSILEVMNYKDSLDELPETLEEGVVDWAREIYRKTFGKMRTDPEDFVKAWAEDRGRGGEYATIGDLIDAIDRRIVEVERFIRKNESLDEGITDILKGGATLIYKGVKASLSWVARNLWKALTGMFRWSSKHPMGRLAWAVYFTQVGMEPLSAVLNGVFPGLSVFLKLGVYLWILYDIRNTVKKYGRAESLGEFFFTRKPSEIDWDEIYRLDRLESG